jgi:hypothetical protein
MIHLGDPTMSTPKYKKPLKIALQLVTLGCWISSCDESKSTQTMRRSANEQQDGPSGNVQLMPAWSQNGQSGSGLNLSREFALAGLPAENSVSSADGVAVTIRYTIRTDRQTVNGTLGVDEDGLGDPKKVDLQLPVSRAMFQITSILWNGEEINISDADQDNPALGWGCKNNQRNSGSRKFRDPRDGSVYIVSPDPANLFPCPAELNRSANTTVKPGFSVNKAEITKVEQSFDTNVVLKSVSVSKPVGYPYPDVSFLRVSACKQKSSSNRYDVVVVFSCKRLCDTVRDAKFSKFKQTIANPQKGISLSPQLVDEVPKAGASACSTDDRGEYDEGVPGEELVAYRFPSVAFNDKKMKFVGIFEGSSGNEIESQRPKNQIYVELSQ